MRGAPISGAVEGIVDEAVVRALLDHAGLTAGTIYVQSGKPRLLQKLSGFNAAARHRPWLVLVDLDRDALCAPTLQTSVLPNPSPQMMFRIAVHQAEAWLMGDREAFASYLRISRALVPLDPEADVDGKQTVVNLARRSRDRNVRNDMVPTQASGRTAGPNYSGRLIEFATQRWRPDVAAEQVDSLRRCLNRLAAL